jgi:hypothetical protein
MKRLKSIALAGALAVACMELLGGCSESHDMSIHRWSKWSDPKITSGMWEGTTVWQMRTNLDTGEVELRAQTASPHGGYYK